MIGDYGNPPYSEPLPFWLLGSEGPPGWSGAGGQSCISAVAGAQFDMCAQAQMLNDDGRVAASFNSDPGNWAASLGFACEGAGGGRTPYVGGLSMTVTHPASGGATVAISSAGGTASIARFTDGSIVYMTAELGATRRWFKVGIWSSAPPISGGTPDLYSETIDCSAYNPAYPLFGPCYPRLGGGGTVKAREWYADSRSLVDFAGNPPIRRPNLVHTIAKLGSRMRHLETVGRGATNRHVFLRFSADGSQAFTWTDSDRDLRIDAATLDGDGTLDFELNGSTVSLPIAMVAGDRLVVNASGTSGALGVTLSESLSLS